MAFIATVLCALGLIAAPAAAAPAATAPAAAAPGDNGLPLVFIVNGKYKDLMLCARADDNYAWLSSDRNDPYCQWAEIGNDSRFILFNPARGMVLSAPGEEGPLTLTDLAFPTNNQQNFSWGGWEQWGARSLQWFANSRENVEAGPKTATKEPVRTHKWGDLDPKQPMTWNAEPIDVPAATLTASVSAVEIINGNWANEALCAATDNTVRLSTLRDQAACQWLPFGLDSGGFVLYNPWLGRVAKLHGGDRQPLSMENFTYPNTNDQLWSLGSEESWDARALQWYGDSGQNVDAGEDAPTTGPVHTRGWNHGNQRQLTWNLIPTPTPAAVVTLGDNLVSGEAGRWQGNSDKKTADGDGTDRAYQSWADSDPNLVYGVSYNNQCDRSDSAEAHSSGLAVVGVDLGCSGAGTVNVLSAAAGGKPFKDEAPQIDQLSTMARRYDVQTIVLSVGGADLGLADVLTACAEAYVTKKPACNTAEQKAVEAKMAGTLKNLKLVIDDIRAAMTAAEYGEGTYRIILQSMPAPLPRAKEIRYKGRPERESTGHCPVYDDDADWLRDKLVPEIDSALAEVAAGSKVDFLDLRDAFQGRELCSDASALVTADAPPVASRNEWVRFMAADGLPGDPRESANPSYFGQLAIGRCLALMVANTRTSQASCHNTPGKDIQGMFLV